MKFSEQWLREWTNPEISSEALIKQMTMAGLEVDGTAPVARPFTGIVVGEVVSVEPHPNADKLRVCSVSDGTDQFQVVCGAPNVSAGMRVPFAKLGANLQDGFTIGKAKLRGVESCGMLCSEEELGLAESADGLMTLPEAAPLGEDVRPFLHLDDTIIDVDLTPNRSDCLSILGLAREVTALNESVLTEPLIQAVEPVNDDTFRVSIKAQTACPRYVGRVIRNVDLSKATPLWMVEKLRRSGIRSIDPVVDVTNFVMLELGQPMHAFDLAELNNEIVVRFPDAEEKLVLLDGQEVCIRPDTLLIADAQKPLALAGIMGGEHSGVSTSTTDIFLESAFFSPINVAGKARSYGLHTESSHRFERGVDSCHQARAVERATALLLSIVGGEPGPTVVTESSEHLPQTGFVSLRHHRVDEVLGIQLEQAQIEALLVRLGLITDQITEDGWVFEVPSHRFDIALEVDLIEEIARLYGYNNLPTTEPLGSMAIPSLPESKTSLRKLKSFLADMAYQEVITYSFVDPKLQETIEPDKRSIALANPIASDMSVMRTSLWPGLLKAAQYNQNRQQERVRMFESGLQFVAKEGGIEQEPVLAGLVLGPSVPENWSQKQRTVDFFDVKGDLESLLATIGTDFSWENAVHHALQPGQTASINKDGEVIGTLGSLHPKIVKTLNLNGPVYIFELLLNAIATGKVPSYERLSRFPEIRRDIAVTVNEATPYADIAEVVASSAGVWCVRYQIFDVYQGESVEQGKKSLAMGITWRHAERTLRDEEITEALNNVIQKLDNRLGATLRS